MFFILHNFSFFKANSTVLFTEELTTILVSFTPLEQYLKTKPFLLSSLSEGIINLTSLSRLIMPEIELHLGKDVKQGAVVMALKRVSEELDFKISHKVSRVMQNIGEITVRSSLTDYTFTTSETLLDSQAKLMYEINKIKDVSSQ